MALGETLLSGGLDIVGGMLGAESAHDEARLQRQWSARQYAKRYQTTVKDLQAAGLNPMLAYMGQGGAGAGSVPSGAASPGGRFDNIGTKMLQTFQAQKLMEANVGSIHAATAKSNQETLESAARTRGQELGNLMVEAKLPFSAEMAQVERDRAVREYVKLGHEIHMIMRNEQDLDNKLDVLNPLIARLKELEIKSAALDIPYKEAEAKFWETLPEATWVKKLREILPSFPRGVFKK